MKVKNVFPTTLARSGDDDRTCFVKYRRPARPFGRTRMALPVAAAIAAGVSAAEPALAIDTPYVVWEGIVSSEWSDENNWSGDAPIGSSKLDIIIQSDKYFPVINNGTFDSGTGTLVFMSHIGHPGRLDITSLGGSDAASLASRRAFIGLFGSGEVNVSGQGATWTLRDSLTIGEMKSSTGTLTVANGATVSVDGGKGTIVLGHNGGSTGALYIGSSDGKATAPGTISAGKLNIGAGNGELIFNHTANDYDFDLAISSSGTGTERISIANGVTRLTGDNSGFQGYTSIEGGTLIVDKTLGGTTTVNTHGTLRGTGTVGDLLVYGVLAPGNSVGTMTVNGNATFESGSTYRVYVDSTGASRTNVNGTATINGGTVDVVSLEVDRGESVLGTYRILQAKTLDGEFDSVRANYAFLRPSLTYDATSVRLVLSVDLPTIQPGTVPEPSQSFLRPLASPFSGNSNQDALVAILDTIDSNDPRYQAFVN